MTIITAINRDIMRRLVIITMETTGTGGGLIIQEDTERQLVNVTIDGIILVMSQMAGSGTALEMLIATQTGLETTVETVTTIDGTVVDKNFSGLING